MIVFEDQQTWLVCKGWDAVKMQPNKRIFMDRVASLDCRLRYHALLESDQWKLNFPQIRKRFYVKQQMKHLCHCMLWKQHYYYLLWIFFVPWLHFSKENFGRINNFLKYFSLYFISINLLWIFSVWPRNKYEWFPPPIL
jgi:hypothetical protein